MANTQVFTLGLGVTVINPLGQAIDLLRRDVERLRRQADGTRLGRLVGEVIRLGLELGKVRQVERQLALDQEQQYEEQIGRLGDEAEAVERLRQHYLMLDRVIKGLAQLKPLTTGAPKLEPVSGSGAKAPDAAARKRRSAADTAMIVTSVLGGGLIVGARTAYEVDRHLPPKRQRRARKAVTSRLQAGAVNALVSGGKAWAEADTPEDKAKGVGAAAGELGGSLIGAAFGASISKSKRVQEYTSMFGGFVGEWAGGLLGGKLFDLAMYEDKPDPKVKNKAPAAASNAIATDESAGNSGKSHAKQKAAQGEQEEIEEEEEEEEEEEDEEDEQFFAQQSPQPAPAAIGAAINPANLIAGTVAGRSVGAASASPSLGRAGASVGRGLLKRVPVGALLDTSLQLAEVYNSDAPPAQKMEGYGGAVGGLGGTLAGAAAGAAIGSVIPVIGTAVGGLIGGVLGSMGGESLGGWLGKTLGTGLGMDDPPVSKQPATPAKRSLTALPVEGQHSRDPATVGEEVRASDAVTKASTSTSATPPAPINQQFTFTANMPVTFNNSLDDPTTLQQLETIARRMLDDLMRQARSVQMADQPQP